jgi:anaerobic C4-dicarboxylate transporter
LAKPIGLVLGLQPSLLLAYYPAANSVAAVSFDSTGTTRVGEYLLNHSFMRSGPVTVIVAIVIALLLNAILS